MQLADVGPFMDKKAFRDSNLHSYFYTACYRHLCSSRGNLGWQKFKLIITITWRIHKTDVHNILHCRPTNYELLRWLVETPSHDFEHYRMTDDSRQSIIWHFHVTWKCRMIGFARWRFNLFECRRRMLQRHLPNGLNERNSVRQNVDRSYK